MARVWLVRYTFLLVALAAGTAPVSAEPLPNPYDAFRMTEMAPDNQLPLLGDRFRIDNHVDEITMVFFRDFGTDPVVLILPDGRKWYSARHPDNVQWETGAGFDQVRIESPMRGPWQVSGALRPESRLMVISDLAFHAEPLPESIYRGETLRIRGEFTEAGQPIEQRDFQNAIDMQMYMVSTNDERYQNFGLNPRQVGQFKDDGRGQDGAARDGVFTGEIWFNVPTGPYLPSYHAITPLHQRTFEQSPIMVEPLPVSMDVRVSEIEGIAHVLTLEVDGEQLRADDLIIRGSVEYPNGEIQLIDISTAQGDLLRERIPNYVNGNFTVDLTLFATTLAGREIRASIPTYAFMARQPEPPGPTDEELAAIRAEQREAEIAAQVAAERERLAQQRTMLWVIVGVNAVLVLAWLGWMLWRRNAKKNQKKATNKPQKAQ